MGSALQGTGTHHLQMLDRWTYLKQNNEHLLEVARCVSNNVSFQVSPVGWWKRRGGGQAWRAGSLPFCPFCGPRGHRAAPALFSALTIFVGSHQVVDLPVGAGGEDLNEAFLIRADTLWAETQPHELWGWLGCPQRGPGGVCPPLTEMASLISLASP